MKGFSTRAMHTRFLRNDPHGSLHMPVYDSVAFEFSTAEDMEAAFRGHKPAHIYTRITNPTIEHFEQKIKNLTGAQGVLALSSGMAAISNLIIAIAASGDNIITTKHLFGNTYSLFENTLNPWGLSTQYADMTQLSQVEKLINSRTKAIFVETITNPQLEVANLEALGKLAQKHKIILIVDTTVTPLNFLDAKTLGVNIEVLSSTKYISGGATSVGGLIIDYGTFDWAFNEKLKDAAKKFGPLALLTKLKREVYRNLGACLSPHNAYLQNLGLETVPLRIQKSCANTLTIALFLNEHPAVTAVNYPGLTSSKFHHLALKQFGNKYGALLTFNLPDKERCFSFMNKLKLVRRATNINDNKTLIIHPASTIYSEFTSPQLSEMVISQNMLRLAVGIEDVEDIIADLKQSLEE